VRYLRVLWLRGLHCHLRMQNRLTRGQVLPAATHPASAAVAAVPAVGKVAVKVVAGMPVVMQPRDPVRAYIGIGANLGDAQQSVRAAVQALSLVQSVQVTQVSSLYLTAPVDSSGPDYINAVVEVSSLLSGPQLLNVLQSIEALHGRERPYRNAPRTLDMDLLLYGEAQIQSANLTVPHPRMWERAFVLLPLAEIAPHGVTPAQLRAVRAQTVAKLQ